MGPHWDFENVKLSINLLSIQTPSILVLVGVPKLIIASVGMRPWSWIREVGSLGSPTHRGGLRGPAP